MRFEISQSLYPDEKIGFLARDPEGVVRLRAESEEKLIEAIKEFNEALAKQAEERAKAAAKKGKGKGASVKGKDETITELAEETTEESAVETQTIEQPEEVGAASAPQDGDSGEPGKKFLKSEIKEQIEEKKRRSGRKSFWDKLK